MKSHRIIERSLERMIAGDRVARPDQYSSPVPAYVDDQMASDSDALRVSPPVADHTGGAFIAVDHPTTLTSQNEVMIPCAQSPSPRPSTGMPVELNESKDESNTGRRKGKYCRLCLDGHAVDHICIILNGCKTSTIPIVLRRRVSFTGRP